MCLMCVNVVSAHNNYVHVCFLLLFVFCVCMHACMWCCIAEICKGFQKFHWYKSSLWSIKTLQWCFTDTVRSNNVWKLHYIT